MVCWLGLFRADDILASSLLAAMPAELVKPAQNSMACGYERQFSAKWCRQIYRCCRCAQSAPSWCRHQEDGPEHICSRPTTSQELPGK